MSGLTAETELAAAAVQAVGEISRGLDILDAEIRSGRNASARDTLATVRAVATLLDEVIPALIAARRT